MKEDETAAPRGPVVPGENQIRGISGFLQILQEMDGAGEARGNIKGEVEGPFFSRAVYECVIRIGMDRNESNTSAHRRSI
ncbi:Uncharacterised protein [uncultured archaeon]|nr:Uncharacterised protein [uncultured archaeon]